MQEMIELSKQPTVIPETPPKAVTYLSQNGKKEVVFAGPAQFGKLLENGFQVRIGTQSHKLGVAINQ